MFVKYEIFGLSIWFWIFIILLNGIIFGSFCSNLADKKGYSPGTWFAGGFFFGIIALIAIAGLPVKWEEFNNLKECPDCREMINIYANVCKYCGYRFTKEEQQEALQKKIIKAYSETEYTLNDIKNLIDLGMTDTLINELLRIFKDNDNNDFISFIQEVSDLIIEKGDKKIIPALEDLLKELKNKRVIGIVKNIIEKLK